MKQNLLRAWRTHTHVLCLCVVCAAPCRENIMRSPRVLGLPRWWHWRPLLHWGEIRAELCGCLPANYIFILISEIGRSKTTPLQETNIKMRLSSKMFALWLLILWHPPPFCLLSNAQNGPSCQVSRIQIDLRVISFFLTDVPKPKNM